MKSLTQCIVALALLAVSAVAGADFNYPMQANEVASGVYAVTTPTRDFPNPENGGWNSNSAFVVTGAGVLLFDSGSSTAIGQALRQVIEQVTEQPVRWIVNSHEHGDHWLGNAAFKDTVEVIYASNEVTDMIVNGGRRWVDTFNTMTQGVTGDSEILPPTEQVMAERSLILGDVRLEFMLSGGSHSPGDLMVWLPDRRVLISGDVVYSDRMPSTNAGNLKQWIETLDKLQALQPRVVIPGHGSVSDQAGLVRLHKLLSSLWQAVEQGVDEGKSDFEMYPDVIEALSDFRDTFPGLEDKIRRDLSHVFLQVEAAVFE